MCIHMYVHIYVCEHIYNCQHHPKSLSELYPHLSKFLRKIFPDLPNKVKLLY